MKLIRAFRVSPAEVVAFVGGGGKTTAMFRLAQELVEAGQTVVTTTTTRIFAAQIELAPQHIEVPAGSTPQALMPAVQARLAAAGHVLLTGALEAGSGKAPGIDPGLVGALRSLPGGPAILLEADGSRMRPFKAPAEHEPVIPQVATLVVPVVGADVFGAPLDDQRVHRPEVIQALTGAERGSRVTPGLVAAVISHLSGGLKGVPAHARVVPLINKISTAAALGPARDAADRMLASDRIQAVALGDVRAEPSIAEVRGRAAAIVLAAGVSSRMGRPKQLLDWRDGRTMLGEVVIGLLPAGVGQILVVTGADREAVEASLRAQLPPSRVPIRFVHNPDFAETGMARSLQTGLRALDDGTDAALVVLGDQPHLPPDVVRAILQRWRESLAHIVAPFHRGRRGHPLLFDRSAWPGLLALPADANPRQYLQSAGEIEAVELDNDAILRDIDVPDDYDRERGRLA
jgi:molybdenum cofactor cytidylyltransferase